MVKRYWWVGLALACVCQAAAAVIDPLKHDVLALNSKNYVDSFGQYRTRFPGAILYYTDASGAADFIQSTWNPLAKKLRGMARIGAVDCSQHKSLCSEVDDDKTGGLEIRVYPPLPQPSYKVDVHLTIAKLRSQILKHLPKGKFDIIKDDEALRAFVGREANIPKIFLFHGEKKPSSWWHAIIHTFTDRMSFAQLGSRELAEKLGIVKAGEDFEKKLPIVALKVKDTSVSSRGVEVFPGGVKDFSKIQEWLNVRSETFARGGGIDHNLKTSSMAKPWLEEKYPELTRASHKDICFSSKDALCAILAVPPSSVVDRGSALGPALDPTLVRMLDDLRQNVKKPVLRYSWVNLAKERQFAEALNLLDATDLPIFIVINPHKRLRFTALRSANTHQDILQFVEKLKSGDARFTPLKNGIPNFVSRVTRTEEL